MDARKKLDVNYRRMLLAILNKSWKQYTSKNQLFSHLPPISKIIQVRGTRHVGHYWRSKDELISDVHLWTPTHGRVRVGRLARIYLHLLCADTWFNLENLSRAMDERNGWRERERERERERNPCFPRDLMMMMTNNLKRYSTLPKLEEILV